MKPPRSLSLRSKFILEDGVRAPDLGPLHNLSIEDVLGPEPLVTGVQ